MLILEANHGDVPNLFITMESHRRLHVAIGDAARACVRAFWATEPFGVWRSSIVVLRKPDGALWSVVFDDPEMNSLQIVEELLTPGPRFDRVPERVVDVMRDFTFGEETDEKLQRLRRTLATYFGVGRDE